MKHNNISDLMSLLLSCPVTYTKKYNHIIEKYQIPFTRLAVRFGDEGAKAHPLISLSFTHRLCRQDVTLLPTNPESICEIHETRKRDRQETDVADHTS